MGTNRDCIGLIAGFASLSKEIPALDIFYLSQHLLREPSYLRFNRGKRKKGKKGIVGRKKKEQGMEKQDLQPEKNNVFYGVPAQYPDPWRAFLLQ